MENLVGELFDLKMAQNLKNEALTRGWDLEMETLVTERGSIYRLWARNPEHVAPAREFFRVKMGLPGAPPAPDPEWVKLQSIPMGFVTKAILIFSVGVFLTRFNPALHEKVITSLFYNTPDTPLFQDILAGQFWRALTPIFLHFSFMHILFNSMWIKDLGSLFEKQRSSKEFLLFILLVGGFSNLGQYLIFGARFGGLSGVAYGLLGYVWVYASLHKDSEFSLPKRDIYMMIGWYFLCLSGLIGNIANIAHGVGLALGMLWGFFPLSGTDGRYKQKVIYFFLAIFFSIGTYLVEIFRMGL